MREGMNPRRGGISVSLPGINGASCGASDCACTTAGDPSIAIITIANVTTLTILLVMFGLFLFQESTLLSIVAISLCFDLKQRFFRPMLVTYSGN
jgi:hypothetical protein